MVLIEILDITRTERLIITILLSCIIALVLRRWMSTIVLSFQDGDQIQQHLNPHNGPTEVVFMAAPSSMSGLPTSAAATAAPTSVSSSTALPLSPSPPLPPSPSPSQVAPASPPSSSDSTPPSQTPLPPSPDSASIYLPPRNPLPPPSSSADSLSVSSSSSTIQPAPAVVPPQDTRILPMLTAPPEIRIELYKAFFAANPIHVDFVDNLRYITPPPIVSRTGAELQDRHNRLPHHCARNAPALDFFYLSRQFRDEAIPLFYAHTTFIFHSVARRYDSDNVVDLCIPTSCLPRIQHLQVVSQRLSWPDSYLPNDIIARYNMNPRTVHMIVNDIQPRAIFGGPLLPSEKAYLNSTQAYRLSFELNAVKPVPRSITDPEHRFNFRIPVDKPWASLHVGADKVVRLGLRADYAEIHEIQEFMNRSLGLDGDALVVDDRTRVLQVTEEVESDATGGGNTTSEPLGVIFGVDSNR